MEKVSILILLEVPLQPTQELQAKIRYDVSILILLEVPLQLLSNSMSLFVLYCFNPYFTGSTTSTKTPKALMQLRFRFQSLFYWKYHFNLSYLPIFSNFFINEFVSILILLEVPLQHISEKVQKMK